MTPGKVWSIAVAWDSRMRRMYWLTGVALLVGLLSPDAAMAKGTGLVFISNERSSTITVLDANDQVVKTMDTCARPRGMHFSLDRKTFYVACADDSLIAIYDVASQELLGRIINVAKPETFGHGIAECEGCTG